VPPDVRPKCTKIDFAWGSAPDPAGGAYSAPQTSYLYLRGLASKGKEGKRKRGGKGKGKGREGGGERPYIPPVANSWLRHCSQMHCSVPSV